LKETRLSAQKGRFWLVATLSLCEYLKDTYVSGVEIGEGVLGGGIGDELPAILLLTVLPVKYPFVSSGMIDVSLFSFIKMRVFSFWTLYLFGVITSNDELRLNVGWDLLVVLKAASAQCSYSDSDTYRNEIMTIPLFVKSQISKHVCLHTHLYEIDLM
jgi:hypothetical protein